MAKFESYNLNMEKWKPKFNNKIDKPFTGSTFHCPPYVYCKDSRPYDGVEYKIYKEITKNWLANVQCINGTQYDLLYQEIVNNSITGNVDISFCSLWTAMISKKKIALTIPYATVCASFLVPKPQLLPTSMFVFQPFQLTLWLLYVAMIIIISIIFYTTDVIYVQMTDSQFFKNYTHALLESLRIITLGSMKRLPKKSQTYFRSIIILSWGFTLLLSTAYSAGIV